MVYLIDFENVNSYGLDGIDTLNAEDKVYIFYSDKAHTLDFEMIDLYEKSKASKMRIKGKTSVVKDGRETIPNYIDFQIATVVGRAIGEGEDVAIVSQDKGFVSVIDYWREDAIYKTPVIVQLAKSIREVKPATKKPEKQEFVENTNLTPVTPPELQKVLDKSPDQDKLRYNLINTFGRIEGCSLYEQHKDRFPKKKKY